MSYLPNQQHVKASSGLWTPVGYAAGDTAVPGAVTHPAVQPLGIYGTLTAYGNQRVTGESGALFYDAFDTGLGLNTVDRWTTGGTITPTLTLGSVQVGTTTAANASSSLQSKPAFVGTGVNFLALGWVARFENISATAGTAFRTGAHRFMGFGQIPTTWATAYTGSATTGPLLHAVGFEIDTDGFLYPVVYDTGVRVRPALLNGQANLNVGRTLPNGEAHQFGVGFRQDAIFFYVDGTEAPVATYSYKTAGYAPPDMTRLSLRFHTLNGGSVIAGGAPTLSVSAVGLGDTGANSGSISDPVNPWQRARVGSGGDLKIGSGRNVVNEGFASTFRIPGANTATINLLTAENTTGSPVHLAIRRIAVDINNAAAYTVVTSYIRLWRGTTVPAAGTALTKHTNDSASTSAANVIVRSGASADGTASAITYALPTQNPMRSQAVPSMATAVGQWLTDDLDMWKFDFPPLILKPGESILVAHTGGNSATTLGYTVKIVWEEFTP